MAKKKPRPPPRRTGASSSGSNNNDNNVGQAVSHGGSSGPKKRPKPQKLKNGGNGTTVPAVNNNSTASHQQASSQQTSSGHRPRPVPQDRPSAAACGGGVESASAATLFASRNAIRGGASGAAAAAAAANSNTDLLPHPPPLPSLPRLVDQLRNLSNSVLGENIHTNGNRRKEFESNIHAAILIFADIWDEAAQLKEERDEYASTLAALEAAEGSGRGTNAIEHEDVNELEDNPDGRRDDDVQEQESTKRSNLHESEADALLDLLSNHAPARRCLAIDVDSYAAFLLTEDIKSPDNLMEAVEDDEYLESILASDGMILPGMCHAFRDAVKEYVDLYGSSPPEGVVPTVSVSPSAAGAKSETQTAKKEKKGRPCKFGKNCRKAGCKFDHPTAIVEQAPAIDDAAAVVALNDAAGGEINKKAKKNKKCHFGAKCRNKRCKFIHPADNALNDNDGDRPGDVDNAAAAAASDGALVENPTTTSTPDGWTCTACTFFNTDASFLSCTVCYSPRSSSSAQQQEQQLAEAEAQGIAAAEARRLEEEVLARKRIDEEEEARKRAEEDARNAEEEARKRAEMERAAAAEAKRERKRRQEEAKRATGLEAERLAKAEEERQRQEALAEKRAALEQYDEKESKTFQDAASKGAASSEEKTDKIEILSSSRQPVSPTSSSSAEKTKPRPITSSAVVPVNSNEKLSTPTRSAKKKSKAPASSDGPLVLYPPFRQTGPGDSPTRARGAISPLFKLLRDPTSLPKARATLPLETEIASLKIQRGGIQLDISACEKEIEKINVEYEAMKDKARSREDWEAMATSQERSSLDALRKRFDTERKKMTEARDGRLYRQRPEVVEEKAKTKRMEVHAKYFAKLDAVEQALDDKKLKIERDRDERLGVFKLEAIEKNKDETLAAHDKRHKDALARLDKQKKDSLAAADRERTAVLAKLDKKRANALAKIKQREVDKLANIEEKRIDKLGALEAKQKEKFKAANISITMLDSILPSRGEKRAIENEIRVEKDSFVKEIEEKKDAVKDEARQARAPVEKEYKSNRHEMEEGIKKKKIGVEEACSKKRPQMIEDYKSKRIEIEEGYEKKRIAVVDEVEQQRDAIEKDYKERMAVYKSERAERMKDVVLKRRAVQPLVNEENDEIDREFSLEMAKVEAYRSSVEQEFEQKEVELKAKYESDKTDIILSTKEFLRKSQMDEGKRATARDEAIAGQRDKIAKLKEDLSAKEKEIEVSRNSLSKVKGHEREEPSFNISTSRDHFGNTFLITAAQRNDILTARICLELGAAPNEANDDGLTAMSFGLYFRYEGMCKLLAHNKATTSKQPFDALLNIRAQGLDQHAVDWESQLRISEQAAIPPDTFLASAEDLDKDEDSKMPTLDLEEQKKDYSCFESRLSNPEATKNYKRIILVEKNVYNWLIDPDRSSVERVQFLSLLRGLIPNSRENVLCHRRAVVGVRPQFEVLCASLDPKRLTAKSTVVHFTPFVSSEVRGGIADIGVLVWAVSAENKASYVKALIEQSEWKRNKIENSSERFLPYTDNVMPLGKDMHLLDLKSTSSWKTGPMTLYRVGVDSGELGRLESNDVNFTPKPRTLESEKILQEQLFRRTQSELEENEQILHDTRPDLSTNLFGGAGTGKTMLLIQKVASDSAPHKKLLVVTRLPRLIGFIKSGVKQQKGVNVNVDYYTYDELMTFLTRRCYPENAADERTFSMFNQIHYSETTGTGATAGLSFQQEFIDGYLTPKERSVMARGGMEPLTLWTAIRVIKSHTHVASNKRPLNRDEYMSLPKIFGLDASQRKLAYDLYEKYLNWTHGTDRYLWDEADRVLYCLEHLGSVFSDAKFISWEERAFKWGEEGLCDADGMPEPPFYHNVFIDEAQDYADLDLSLFVRLSSGVRSVFLGADPAQSVESGIRMREGGINDVFHSCLPSHVQVKDVLQDIRLITNHRTHQQNLDLSKAIRRVLSRSFCVPGTDENSIAKGPVPEALLVKKLSDLASHSTFKGVNLVFIVPDENLSELRRLFLKLGIKNDLFGVREAKGLEFDNCCVLGFFNYFEQLGSAKEWQNCLRWLFSRKGIKETESSEAVNSVRLQNCDYLLSHPELEDQAMMLYTAVTRARNHLYIIEDEESGKMQRRGKGSGLGEFAFRLLQQLHLIKRVQAIDAGETEMTPQEHNARGVLLVTKAIALSNKGAKTEDVIEKFEEAADRFRPDKGCDASLLFQCEKHLKAILTKRALIQELKTNFFSQKRGEYLLAGRFSQVLAFETKAADFVTAYIDDPFVVDEVRQLGVFIEDVFFGSPYWIHFDVICEKIKLCCT